MSVWKYWQKRSEGSRAELIIFISLFLFPSHSLPSLKYTEYPHKHTHMYPVQILPISIYTALKPSTSTFIKINKSVQRAGLCSTLHPAVKASFGYSTSFPAVPLLRLKVRFYIPCHTTFPTKMAPLRNSLCSLSQHDLLVWMCVCACIWECSGCF